MLVFGQPARAVYGNRASGLLSALLRHTGTGACRSAARLLAATMGDFEHREGVFIGVGKQAREGPWRRFRDVPPARTACLGRAGVQQSGLPRRRGEPGMMLLANPRGPTARPSPTALTALWQAVGQGVVIRFVLQGLAGIE